MRIRRINHRNSTAGLCSINRRGAILGFAIDVIPHKNLVRLGGNGLFSWMKGLKESFINKILRGRPKVLNDLIEKEGNQMILRIDVCRVPITKIFKDGLNVLTLGKLTREMKKLGYDELYHLFAIFYLADGKIFSLEKNERVNVIDGIPDPVKGSSTVCRSLNYNKKTFGEFIFSAEKDKQIDFYRYSPFKGNCQRFVYDLFMANGISDFNDFILQDIESLAPSYLKWIVNRAMDLYGTIDYLKKGGAIDDSEDLNYDDEDDVSGLNFNFSNM